MKADRLNPWTRLAGVFSVALLSALAQPAAVTDPAILQSGFIAAEPSYPSSHASTLVETPDGLVAAWFGGSEEGAVDVGIWLARHNGTAWLPAQEVANGIDTRRGQRYPCWNPVLFSRRTGELLLFYKVGPSPASWWGMVRTSPDNGASWVRSARLPEGITGPVRNKPVELDDGTILCGASLEDKGWRVHMEWTKNPLGTWSRGPDLNAAYTMAAIQPTILQYSDWRFQILCRSKQGKVMESWTTNRNGSWSALARTTLLNPNSALDGVVLRDGRTLLVCNHSTSGRGTLDVLVSPDGREWQAAAILENEPGREYSYPAVIQAQDGKVHVTYTWRRERIKHVVLDPTRLQGRPLR